MKKIILASLILVISGCSTGKVNDQNKTNSDKRISVEQVKKGIISLGSIFKKGDEGAQKEEKVAGNWDTHTSELGFTLKYPQEVEFYPSNKEKSLLVVKVLDLDTLSATSTIGEGWEKLANDIEKGEAGENWGVVLENSRKISKIGDTYVRKGVVFSSDESCDVIFEKEVIFAIGRKLVTISLLGNKDAIIKENIDYFRDNIEICPDNKVWRFERQSEFYQKLEQNELSGSTKIWFDLFDEIIDTLEISPIVSDEVNIDPQTLGSENSELIWPQISGIKDQVISEKVAKIIDFEKVSGKNIQEVLNAKEKSSYVVNYNDNNILSLSLYVNSKSGEPGKIGKNILIDLKKGEALQAKDVFKKDKINDLLSLCDKKLQENISKYKIEGYSDRKFEEGYLENFIFLENGFRFDVPPIDNKLATQEVYVIVSLDETKDYLMAKEIFE